MGAFSLCVENTARDIQSLLTLHKVHPKVCIDVRRRMDLLIEKAYEEMDVLEPGYGESAYDICHAIAKSIVHDTLEVGIPKSELSAAERRVAERDQDIFTWKQRAESAEVDMQHATAVVKEVKRAHEFMLHTYFREVLVLRHQIEDLKKKVAAAPANPGVSGKTGGFPRFSGGARAGGAMTTHISPASTTTTAAPPLEDSGETDGRLTSLSAPPGTFSEQASPYSAHRGSMHSSNDPGSMSQRVDSPVTTSVTRGVTPASRASRPVPPAPPAPAAAAADAQNAIFDYHRYVSLLKETQVDYEERYKALLAERGEMLKRHREARVKAMLENKHSVEESKFMIEELTKQLEASRAMSLMGEYKLRMCTEPVKEELNSLLNEIRMDVHHMQDEYSADMKRMSEAVTEVQDRSEALLDFVLTYVQAVSQLVVVVYEDASTKTEETLQNDPFTAIGYILPNFFTVGENEKRMKPLIRLDESQGVTTSASKSSSKKKQARKAQVSINEPQGGGADAEGVEEAAQADSAERANYYDASAAKFWSEHPVARSAARVLSEFQALAMQLRARKEILLKQKSGSPKMGGGAGEKKKRGRGKQQQVADDGRPTSGGRPPSGGRSGGRQKKAQDSLSVIDVDGVELDIEDEFDLPAPTGGGLLVRNKSPRRSKSPSLRQRSPQQQQQGSRQSISSGQLDGREKRPSSTSGSGSLRQKKSQEQLHRHDDHNSREDEEEEEGGRVLGDENENSEQQHGGGDHAETTTTGSSSTHDDLSSARGHRRTHSSSSHRRGQQPLAYSSRSSESEDSRIAMVDTSGLNQIYKKQVELLQEHVQQLQLQLLQQHEQLVKYHKERKHLRRRTRLGGGGDRTPGGSYMSATDPDSSTLDDSAMSASSNSLPPLPQLDYVPPEKSSEILRGKSKKGGKNGPIIHEEPPTSADGEEGGDILQVMGNTVVGGSSYQRMLVLAMENNKKKLRDIAAGAAGDGGGAPPPPRQIHPYYMQDPPEGWRCPFCDGYFTMEEAMKALADHPAPRRFSVTRLKFGWLDRPVQACAGAFGTCRDLVAELRRLRYKRLVLQKRWSVARVHTGPVIYSPSTPVPPAGPTTSFGVMRRLCARYERLMDRTSQRIVELLSFLKKHATLEEEHVEVEEALPNKINIMHSLQPKRAATAMARSPYLVKPLNRKPVAKKRKSSVLGEDEEDDEESDEETDVEAQRNDTQQKSFWIMELGGRKMEISSYWTEPLREQALREEARRNATRAHHRALKKRGMFQSPFGAVAGYCRGVQQGLPALEAHRGPVYLAYDEGRDRYFVTNEYGHSALEQPRTSDAAADMAGPPGATVSHPAEAPSAMPFPMTQVIIPAPFSLLPAPYNELAFAMGSRGTTVSDGYVIFTDPDVPAVPSSASSQIPRPASSPGPRELQDESNRRQKDILQPVYMVPMTVPMDPSEYAYHGSGKTREAGEFQLHKDKPAGAGGAWRDGSSSGGGSDDDSRPSSQRQATGAGPSVETGPSSRLPPLPASLRMTAYGMLMTQDPYGRIVSGYEPPVAAVHALQNPPRVSRPRNMEQQMFRIHGYVGAGEATTTTLEAQKMEEEAGELSPRQKVVSELRKAKIQRAARLAAEQMAEEERRRERQEEWDSRHDVDEPIEKEKFFRLRLPKVPTSSKDSGALPDPQAAVKLQRRLTKRDLVSNDGVKKPVFTGGSVIDDTGVYTVSSATNTAPTMGGAKTYKRQPSASNQHRKSDTTSTK